MMHFPPLQSKVQYDENYWSELFMEGGVPGMGGGCIRAKFKFSTSQPRAVYGNVHQSINQSSNQLLLCTIYGSN